MSRTVNFRKITLCIRRPLEISAALIKMLGRDLSAKSASAEKHVLARLSLVLAQRIRKRRASPAPQKEPWWTGRGAGARLSELSRSLPWGSLSSRNSHLWGQMSSTQFSKGGRTCLWGHPTHPPGLQMSNNQVVRLGLTHRRRPPLSPFLILIFRVGNVEFPWEASSSLAAEGTRGAVGS